MSCSKIDQRSHITFNAFGRDCIDDVVNSGIGLGKTNRPNGQHKERKCILHFHEV